MNLSNLPQPPRQVSFVRQADSYERAGIEDYEFQLSLPFASNFEHFFNTEALEAAGISPVGLARQIDQVSKENLGNAFAAAVRKAESKGAPLPAQEFLDELFAKYDFSGVRVSSGESMSAEESAVRTELRSAIRALLRGGSLHPEGIDSNGNTVVSTGVQTKDEADKNELPPGKIDLDTFESLVEAALENSVATVEWDNCKNPENNGSYVIDFSDAPEYDEDGEPSNLSAVAEAAKNLAMEKLALRKKGKKTIRASVSKV